MPTNIQYKVDDTKVVYARHWTFEQVMIPLRCSAGSGRRSSRQVSDLLYFVAVIVADSKGVHGAGTVPAPNWTIHVV